MTSISCAKHDDGVGGGSDDRPVHVEGGRNALA